MNTVLAERVILTKQIVQIVRGDITEEATDAIVNAANEQLQHGAGVAGAILRGGGASIQQESDAWVSRYGRVSHSQPAWTSGGRLPAKYVIHAVGPVWGEGDEDAKLASSVNGSLEVADELKLTSISLPAISTGIFGFPRDRAADITITAIENYFSLHKSGIRLVRLVLFDEDTVKVYMKRWQKVER